MNIRYNSEIKYKKGKKVKVGRVIYISTQKNTVYVNDDEAIDIKDILEIDGKKVDKK